MRHFDDIVSWASWPCQIRDTCLRLHVKIGSATAGLTDPKVGNSRRSRIYKIVTKLPEESQRANSFRSASSTSSDQKCPAPNTPPHTKRVRCLFMPHDKRQEFT